MTDYSYDALERLTKDVLTSITDFKKDNDDILIRFNIEVINRGIAEDYENPIGITNKKRKIKK